MKKRTKRAVLALLGVAGIPAILLRGTIGSHPKLPAYGGHPLDYWLAQAPCSGVAWLTGGVRVVGITVRVRRNGKTYGSTRESPERAIRAIQQIGTNGLPFLISMLRRHEIPLLGRAKKFLIQQGIMRAPADDLVVRREQATTALLALRPLPPEWRSQILKLSTNAPNEVAASAQAVLAGGDIAKLQWPTNFTAILP